MTGDTLDRLNELQAKYDNLREQYADQAAELRDVKEQLQRIWKAFDKWSRTPAVFPSDEMMDSLAAIGPQPTPGPQSV